jgi:hypothetical protein
MKAQRRINDQATSDELKASAKLSQIQAQLEQLMKEYADLQDALTTKGQEI